MEAHLDNAKIGGFELQLPSRASRHLMLERIGIGKDSLVELIFCYGRRSNKGARNQNHQDSA
jgi:hypothetical protein